METVMSAVCVLFQRKPDWPTAKQMLGDPNFLKKLLQFDKNSVPDKVSLEAGQCWYGVQTRDNMLNTMLSEPS